jgi:hypothetical protein
MFASQHTATDRARASIRRLAGTICAGEKIFVAKLATRPTPSRDDRCGIPSRTALAHRTLCRDGAVRSLTIYFLGRKLIGGNAALNRLRIVAMSGNKKQPITMSGNLMRSPRMNLTACPSRSPALAQAGAARPAMTSMMPRTGLPGAHLSTNAVANLLMKPRRSMRPRAPGHVTADAQCASAGRAPFHKETYQ